MTDNAPATLDLAGWRRYLTPSLTDVVFMTFFALAIMLGANLTQRDGDLAKHLRIGQSIIEEGQLPVVDIYSHTMRGAEMVPYEWLAQTIFATTERLLGFDGIGLLTAVLSAIPWAILYRWMVSRGRPVGVSLALALLGAAASMIHWAARPHIFTWLFVVIWVILLEDYRTGHRQQVLMLIPLALVWVNTHGGFFVGYVLISTHLIGTLVARRGANQSVALSAASPKHLLLVLLGTVAVSFANPAGTKGFLYPFAHLLGDDFLFEFTREFTSPDFHNFFFWPFLVMVLTSLAVPFRRNPTNLLLTLSWTALALYALRNIPLYALVVTPILATAWNTRSPRSDAAELRQRLHQYGQMEAKATGGSLSVIFVLVTASWLAQVPGSSFDFASPFFPIEAVEAIENEPPGENVFNQFIWGGYLVYCCHQEIPVFIDGQTDHYGPELTREYDLAIRGMPEWRQILSDHSIDWVLISPDTGLASVLSAADEWTQSYGDEHSLVFIRSP